MDLNKGESIVETKTTKSKRGTTNTKQDFRFYIPVYPTGVNAEVPEVVVLVNMKDPRQNPDDEWDSQTLVDAGAWTGALIEVPGHLAQVVNEMKLGTKRVLMLRTDAGPAPKKLARFQIIVALIALVLVLLMPTIGALIFGEKTQSDSKVAEDWNPTNVMGTGWGMIALFSAAFALFAVINVMAVRAFSYSSGEDWVTYLLAPVGGLFAFAIPWIHGRKSELSPTGRTVRSEWVGRIRRVRWSDVSWLTHFTVVQNHVAQTKIQLGRTDGSVFKFDATGGAGEQTAQLCIETLNSRLLPAIEDGYKRSGVLDYGPFRVMPDAR